MATIDRRSDDSSGAADPPAARALREELVRQVAHASPGLDQRVLAALRAVPRHLFVPHAALAEAYGDHALSIGHRQTISQPTVVAIMSDALALQGSENVLEIGTGSGYQAAVLSRLARHVDSVEVVAPLAEQARDRLARLRCDNVEVRVGDGYAGLPERAPFGAIVLTAAPPDLPTALFDQLADGGRLVAPVGVADEQVLGRWTKRAGTIAYERLAAVRFVPMVHAGGPTGQG